MTGARFTAASMRAARHQAAACRNGWALGTWPRNSLESTLRDAATTIERLCDLIEDMRARDQEAIAIAAAARRLVRVLGADIPGDITPEAE